MDNVKELLTSALDPQARLKQETRGLVSKWDKTGLLEGLRDDIAKSNMAVLLENQAKQLIEESSATGTSANSEQWAGVALPLVRRVFAEIAAKEFVSVQPMNLPSGLVFYLDFKYGTNSGVFTKDSATNYSSLFGGVSGSANTDPWKLGSTNAPVGGLYGPGRYGYTVNDQIAWATVTSASATLADINFDTGGTNDPVNQSISASYAAGRLWTVTTSGWGAAVLAASGSSPDFNAVRSFSISGSGIVTYLPGFTRYSGNEAVFVVSGSSGINGPVTPALINFSVQPRDTSRGDFEDKLGLASGDTGLNKDIGIPEVNLELKSEANRGQDPQAESSLDTRTRSRLERLSLVRRRSRADRSVV
jgi:hypothetical protein